MSRKTNDHGEPFGSWLKVRAGSAGDVGRLASIAAKDRRITDAATPEYVRGILLADEAEGDLFEALDEAEIDWLAL